MFWPDMVLNQGQLSIGVSDWEPYLGSLSLLSVWELVFVCWHYCLKLGFGLVIVFVGVILNKKGICTLTTLHHAAPSTAVTQCYSIDCLSV
jgi:hypothetical protein